MIKINDKYFIDTDPMHIILYERTTITGKGYGKKPKPENIGKDHFAVVGYFATSKYALEYMVEHEIKGIGFQDIKLVVDKIEELRKDILGLKEQVLPRL